MRSRIFKVFLLLLVIAIAATGVFFLLSRLNSTPSVPPSEQTSNPPPSVPGGTLPSVANTPGVISPPTVVTPPVRPLTPEERFMFELVTVGKDFAARYGSFSAQNSYQNYRDLFPFTTPRLRVILEGQIKKSSPSPTYYLGITSRAYSGRVVDFTPGLDQYRVEVELQRVEKKNSIERTFNQTILLTVVRWDAVWLVDEAVWQPTL